jgi:hypothetical protein
MRNSTKKLFMRLACMLVLLGLMGFSSCTKEPTLILNLPANYLLGDTLRPDVQSTNISSWVWDFGDGSTSNLMLPPKYYSKPGTYTVVLTGTTADGKRQVRQQVVVKVDAPVFSIGLKLTGNGPNLTVGTNNNPPWKQSLLRFGSAFGLGGARLLNRFVSPQGADTLELGFGMLSAQGITSWSALRYFLKPQLDANGNPVAWNNATMATDPGAVFRGVLSGFRILPISLPDPNPTRIFTQQVRFYALNDSLHAQVSGRIEGQVFLIPPPPSQPILIRMNASGTFSLHFALDKNGM